MYDAVLPPGFWARSPVAAALSTCDLPALMELIRNEHGWSQRVLAAVLGYSQAWVCRVLAGQHALTIDQVRTIAPLLGIPLGALRFAPGGDPTDRRQFSQAVTAVGMAATIPNFAPTRDPAVHQAGEWLAWHLWRHRAEFADRSEIPAEIVGALVAHPHVIVGRDLFRFTDRGLVDVLVANRIFGDLAGGSGHLLATAQTSHDTDLALGAMTARDDSARRILAGWMRQGATPVARVNAIGVASKVGRPELGDLAIATLHADPAARSLYLAAVANRVLRIPWDQAVLIGSDRSPVPEAGVERLATELFNHRDAAGRWSAAILLSRLSESDRSRTALAQAIHQEPCRENLRAFATVLSGTSPLNPCPWSTR